MKVFWVQMIDLNLFFRYFKGRCHGNQFCKNGRLPSFIAHGCFPVEPQSAGFLSGQPAVEETLCGLVGQGFNGPDVAANHQ